MTNQAAGDNHMVDNKVIPVMREAIMTVHMVLFKVLRHNLHDRYVDQVAPFHAHLAAAVIHNLFGTHSEDAAVADFSSRNRELVERELRELAVHCTELLPILTDTLRMKTICDNQQGVHSIPSLLMAKALGLLQEDRPLPLPSIYMLQVRTLAASQGLIEPMQAVPPDADAPV